MRALLTRRFVKVSAEDRLIDVSGQIAENRASHCIVLEQPRGEFLGVVRVRDAAAMPIGRIFADLISPVPTFRVAKSLTPTAFVQWVARENLEDAVVLSNSGQFVGVVTRESLCDWQLKERIRTLTTLENRATVQDRLVARLGRKIRTQAAALKEAIAQLEEFSYAVSHDVRTPLRAMRGYAAALQEDYGPRLDETAKDYLQRIILAGQRLDRLMLGVHSYSLVSRAQVRVRRLDLGEIVAEAIAEKKRTTPGADIRVVAPLEGMWGVRTLLSQCISQLLDNALKFSVKGRPPVVRVWSERVGKDARLWVEDNGLGVRPEHHERIFQLFEQIHGEAAFDGIGMGLAIVRRAMEKMGGTVGVETAGESTGSRFWLRLRG